jgi:hypothetical protein
MPAVESLVRLVTTQFPAPRYEKYEISGPRHAVIALHEQIFTGSSGRAVPFCFEVFLIMLPMILQFVYHVILSDRTRRQR